MGKRSSRPFTAHAATMMLKTIVECGGDLGAIKEMMVMMMKMEGDRSQKC